MMVLLLAGMVHAQLQRQIVQTHLAQILLEFAQRELSFMMLQL
jgi:hypothetical protein